MAKGRRFNPPLDKDGRWFPHIGVTQKTPESITSVMLKEPHNPRFFWQVEEKLPPIYKAREKQATHNNFPFSVHDNRHSLRSSGFYVDSGLGRRKVAPEKRQHVSRNFNLWACDFVPSYLDGFSNNQISYVCPEAVVVPLFRRFPRQYSEVWGTWKFIPEQSYAEFLKKKPKVRFAIDKKATSSLEPLCLQKSLDELSKAGMSLGYQLTRGLSVRECVPERQSREASLPRRDQKEPIL